MLEYETTRKTREMDVEEARYEGGGSGCSL